MLRIITKNTVQSTNLTLKTLEHATEGTVLSVYNQTAGRGMGSNTWESQPGKNITASILLQPKFIAPPESFLISMAVSVGIERFLARFSEHVHIKWPNDIYVHDQKIAGILIENTFTASKVSQSIAGVGLNVNQLEFSNAPNPISLKQLTHEQHNIQKLTELLFTSILTHYYRLKTDAEAIYTLYHKKLYKINEWQSFEDKAGRFEGIIKSVDVDGRLSIIDRNNGIRHYYFKEVRHLI